MRSFIALTPNLAVLCRFETMLLWSNFRKSVMSADLAAHVSAIKYPVEHGITPKQTIETMSSTQKYSSVNRQVVYKRH